jgi:peptidoglycan/xylan/chitin deacetylase (PgdA/CDA1 family)
MSKNKISFGGHTKTHFYLGSIKDEKAAFEQILGSKKAIEEKISLPVDYFCYPSGGFNEKAKELVVKAGYQGACTTNRGFAKFNRDVYELKRIKVTNSDAVKPFSFSLKLSGYYNILRKEKRGY